MSLGQLIGEGFRPVVMVAVNALIKCPGESHTDTARRAAIDPVALQVKLADNAENMDLSRIADPSEKDFARLEEYQAVREILLGRDVAAI